MNTYSMRERHRLSKRPVGAKAAGALRIAVVGSSLKLAGAEKQSFYMSRALLDDGIDVRFFHLGQGGYYEKALRAMGFPVVQIYKRNRPLHILARTIKAFCSFRPQIVFAPQFGDLVQSGLAGRCCNALVVGGLRSDGFYELNEHGRWSEWMLRLAHGIIANSHRAKRNLLSQKAKAPPIAILPNVLDLREFDARSQMAPPISIAEDRVVAAAIGNLLPCKRFDRFLRALAQARRSAPALLGVIAGADCGAGPDMAQEAKELGLTRNDVIFLGACDNVPALLTQCGFLVLCSDYEGFPNVVLEAMAASLPVISTPVGDAERIVREDQTGYMVDLDDTDSMAERMVELANSPLTRRRLGAEGRRCVEQEFDYETLLVRLLSVFHDFAGQNRRHRLMRRLEAWLAGPGIDTPIPRYRQPALAQHV